MRETERQDVRLIGVQTLRLLTRVCEKRDFSRRIREPTSSRRQYAYLGVSRQPDSSSGFAILSHFSIAHTLKLRLMKGMEWKAISRGKQGNRRSRSSSHAKGGSSSDARPSDCRTAAAAADQRKTFVSKCSSQLVLME